MPDDPASTVGCRCETCIAVEDDDPGPPITTAQRVYCDLFVEWMRTEPNKRLQVEQRLANQARQILPYH